MFCSKCGAQMPDGSKFCEKCGSPIEQYNSKEVKDIPKKKSWKKVMLGILGIALVLGVGISVYLYYQIEVIPNKVIETVSDMTLEGYEIPIESAMNMFFDRKSGNEYEWEVEEYGGRYYVTIDGNAHGAHYDFHFWYSEDLSEVTISDIEADGEKLSEGSKEEYEDFLNEVFGASIVPAADTTVPDVKEPDVSSESMPDDSDTNMTDNIQEDTTVDESKYDACDDFEPELHDFVTEESDYEIELALTYTRLLCGRFDLYANYYDQDGNLVNEHETGVFDEELSGNGVIKFDTGEEGSYYVDYSCTPATLILYGNDGIEVQMVDMTGM